MFYRYQDCRGYFYGKTFENFPAVSSHGWESKKVDFGFQSLVGFQILELYSGFQSQGLPIPQAKFSPIPESGFPYMGRTVPITRGEGGGGEWEWRWYSRFQMKGMIEWGQKIKPAKKSPGLPTKPKKIPGPNINAQKILCQISEGQVWLYFIGRTTRPRIFTV